MEKKKSNLIKESLQKISFKHKAAVLKIIGFYEEFGEKATKQALASAMMKVGMWAGMRLVIKSRNASMKTMPRARSS